MNARFFFDELSALSRDRRLHKLAINKPATGVPEMQNNVDKLFTMVRDNRDAITNDFRGRS